VVLATTRVTSATPIVPTNSVVTLPGLAKVNISFSSLRSGRSASGWRWLLPTKPIRSYRFLAESLPSSTQIKTVCTAAARKRSRTIVSIPIAIPERRCSGETHRYSK
jgi:hypothetical protein